MHDRFMRWVLGVNWRTPGYLVKKELTREKLRGKAGLRVWSFEQRLREVWGREIARK